jgi:AcrR family transcriptional regulator
MPTKTIDRASARERLLTAATELFYEEGVRSVGIDRVIERAGVAKATLYSAFGSKEELIRAYLERRHALNEERMTRELAARYDDPRRRLLGVFDVLSESFLEPGYRGCAFVNASAESPRGGPVEEASDGYRAWRRELMVDLARQAGAADPEGLGRQLGLIYDGAMIAAKMDRDPAAAVPARAIAATLIDAAIPA